MIFKAWSLGMILLILQIAAAQASETCFSRTIYESIKDHPYGSGGLKPKVAGETAKPPLPDIEAVALKGGRAPSLKNLTSNSSLEDIHSAISALEGNPEAEKLLFDFIRPGGSSDEVYLKVMSAFPPEKMAKLLSVRTALESRVVQPMPSTPAFRLITQPGPNGYRRLTHVPLPLTDGSYAYVPIGSKIPESVESYMQMAVRTNRNIVWQRAKDNRGWDGIWIGDGTAPPQFFYTY